MPETAIAPTKTVAVYWQAGDQVQYEEFEDVTDMTVADVLELRTRDRECVVINMPLVLSYRVWASGEPRTLQEAS